MRQLDSMLKQNNPDYIAKQDEAKKSSPQAINYDIHPSQNPYRNKDPEQEFQVSRAPQARSDSPPRSLITNYTALLKSINGDGKANAGDYLETYKQMCAQKENTQPAPAQIRPQETTQPWDLSKWDGPSSGYRPLLDVDAILGGEPDYMKNKRPESYDTPNQPGGMPVYSC